MLVNKSSPKQQFSCRLQQVLPQGFPCVLLHSFYSLIFISFPRPAAEEQIHSRMVPQQNTTQKAQSHTTEALCLRSSHIHSGSTNQNIMYSVFQQWLFLCIGFLQSTLDRITDVQYSFHFILLNFTLPSALEIVCTE